MLGFRENELDVRVMSMEMPYCLLFRHELYLLAERHSSLLGSDLESSSGSFCARVELFSDFIGESLQQAGLSTHWQRIEGYDFVMEPFGHVDGIVHQIIGEAIFVAENQDTSLCLNMNGAGDFIQSFARVLMFTPPPRR